MLIHRYCKGWAMMITLIAGVAIATLSVSRMASAGDSTTGTKSMVLVKAWTVDTSMTPLGQQADVFVAGNLMMQPGWDTKTNSTSSRSVLTQISEGEEPRARDLGVTLIGTGFPYDVQITYTGWDAKDQAVAVNGTLRFAQEGEMKGLLSEHGRTVLMMQVTNAQP